MAVESPILFGRPSTSTHPRYFRIAMALVLALFWLFATPITTLLPGNNVAPAASTSHPRILRLSMLYGETNMLYERAIRTHQAHCDKWGEQFMLLREDLTTGFWNKPTFMLNMMLGELMKPGEERAEWLLWVDADSIILNPSMSAATFLPPADLEHIHVVATQDQNGLNTGVFFLKVDPWSVSFLVETLAMPLYKQELDLGRSADQEAMAMVLNRTVGGPDKLGYRDGIAYVPRGWINTYEFHQGYEGKPGDMLVHFPGLEEDRWEHMAKWLDLLDARPEEWTRDLRETRYINATHDFWEEYRSSMRLLVELEQFGKPDSQPTNNLDKAVQAVKTGLQIQSDDVPHMRLLRAKVYNELKLAREGGQ